MTDKIWIASFDIGKLTFSYCIEEIDLTELSKIENIPKQDRYFKDGTATLAFANVLKRVYGSGKIVLLESVDLTWDCDKSAYLDPKTFINMNTILDKYKDYWNKCSAFVIEMQMAFKQKRNIMALKLGQHCYSYFTFNYSSFKQIVEFPSYHKTKVLGAPKKMTGHFRKKWAVTKGMEILTLRDDKENIKLVQERKKADDMCDTVVQLQAYKYLVFVDKSI